MQQIKYKRVLLKLSGEQFGGDSGVGIDSDFINKLARDLKKVIDKNHTQLAIVVGGGNFVRGKEMKVKGLKEETAHYMGILSTIINGLVLADVLKSYKQPAYMQSTLSLQTLDNFNSQKAIHHLKKGEVLIIVGGTGKPFVTTDTGAVKAAVELNCDAVLKATKVDGVYDKDPKKHSGAKKINQISYAEAIRDPNITVMDKTALSLAKDNNLSIHVFKSSAQNIQKVIEGRAVGTKVSN